MGTKLCKEPLTDASAPPGYFTLTIGFTTFSYIRLAHAPQPVLDSVRTALHDAWTNVRPNHKRSRRLAQRRKVVEENKGGSIQFRIYGRPWRASDLGVFFQTPKKLASTDARRIVLRILEAVSYTHLTLPTICSV